MPDPPCSRPDGDGAAAAAGSLVQHVPGAFPAPPPPPPPPAPAPDAPPPPLGRGCDGPGRGFEGVSHALFARRADYVRPKHVRVRIGSWNVAACEGTEKDVSRWFVAGAGSAGQLPALPAAGLYVLALQEIIDITAVTPALRPHDPAAGRKWKDAVAAALPAAYTLVAEQQLVGLLLLIYAAPALAPDITAVSTTSVGTGLLGLGNKGAVAARLVLGDTTTLVFVNSHLAAGADASALDRRNWHAQQIVSRTRFEPIPRAVDVQHTAAQSIGDEDFCFWCGDLNYRLEGVPGEDIRRLLMLHTPSVQHRLSLDAPASPANRQAETPDDPIAAADDPHSLQATINSLLPHDELRQQMKARKAFCDGWREGPITFLPTYKYDVGSVAVFDSSEKQRAPSWCDRILFRTRKDKLADDARVRAEQDAKKKDAEMEARGIDRGASEEQILYDYDPDTDGADVGDYDEYDDRAEQGEMAAATTRQGFEDGITLEYYTAHQQVLSSDHKPLDAAFLLKYDAVVPELKAKVHAEVAKALDKAENEGRPNVTVVVDQMESATPVASHTSLPGGRSDEGVSFGHVRWSQNTHRSLTIANTSRVPSTFSFIERPLRSSQLAGIAPRWLELSINDVPMRSGNHSSEAVTLEPGETAHVGLDLKVKDMDDVTNLNHTPELEDILVLRVESGRDHFIPIRAHWLESSLNRTIDTLCRIPEGGIRKLQGQMPQHPKEKPRQAADAATAAHPFGNTLERTTSGDSTASQGSAESVTVPPVRFSAPRELFRLTEAIEELSTRVIAEWEMLHDAPPSTPISPRSPSVRSSMDSGLFSARPSADTPKAPWDDHPAWPFDQQTWGKAHEPRWDEALSLACNALDEDQPIERSWTDDLAREQRLYVLCDLLLVFLRNIPDGVVSPDLWSAIDAYLTDAEKARLKPTRDEQTTAIQEILSRSPSHNISFVLITSTLERILRELSGVSKPETEPSALPMSPGKRALGGLRRIATSKAKVAPASQKDLASTALARLFADPLIRTADAPSEKTRSAQEKRKVDVIELFLKRGEPG